MRDQIELCNRVDMALLISVISNSVWGAAVVLAVFSFEGFRQRWQVSVSSSRKGRSTSSFVAMACEVTEFSNGNRRLGETVW